VVVDNPCVKEVHARVHRGDDGSLFLRATTARPIALSEGGQTWELLLTRGVSFIVGETVFACDEVPVAIPDIRKPFPTEAEKAESPEMLGLNCGTCHRIVATLPAAARFCPRCGSTLATNRPDLSFLGDAFLRPKQRGLFSWLLPLRRADRSWRLLGRRPGTLIAYVNSLINMARRYENARGADKNLDQAIRYYEKAAKLGSGTAREKLNSTLAYKSDDPPFAPRV